MPKIPNLRGHYAVRRNADCVWCGRVFMTNHRNARTCAQKCRSRLAAFRALTGFDPEEPPGTLTARQAFAALVEQLLEDERKRRAFATAVREGGAEKLFEVAKQQPPSPPATKRRA